MNTKEKKLLKECADQSKVHAARAAARFTPGPWKAVALDPDNTTQWARFQVQAGTVKKEAVADILYFFGKKKVFMNAGANARLIAAAPELLAVLKEWREVYKEGPANPQEFSDMIANLERITDTVIAEAEGK